MILVPSPFEIHWAGFFPVGLGYLMRARDLPLRGWQSGQKQVLRWLITIL
jgi:hypothetical protein